MFKRFSANYMAMLLVLDGLWIQVALWLAMKLRFVIPLGQVLSPEWVPQFVTVPSVELHVVVGALWLVAFLLASLYTPRRIIRWYDEFSRLLVVHTTAAFSLAGLLYMASTTLPRLTFAYFYLLVLLGLFGYRSILRYWHRYRQRQSNSAARILIVGAGRVGQNLVGEFRRQGWPGLQFVGFLDDDPQKSGASVNGLPVLGTSDDAARIVVAHHVDEVIIALPTRAHLRLTNLVAQLHEQPVRVRVVPDYFELAFFGATVESLGGIPLIGLRDPAIDGFQRLLKRLIDMTVSAVGLLVLSPLLSLVALLIKVEDGGPVFYHADRVGENGKLFRMLKFRSMVINADKIQHLVNQTDIHGHILHKSEHDPRVTRVGRLIRRTSIDELPQLWNVLIGDMSLVGPRPELPWLVEKYEPWQRKRFAVPQGITGWWQVNGRSDKPMHLHSEEDLYYIQNYSLWLDFRILFKTVMVVFKGKGAY